MTRSFLRSLRARQVVANTVDGRSFRGVLTGVYRDTVVLNEAEWLSEDIQKLEGRVAVPRENLSWVQVL